MKNKKLLVFGLILVVAEVALILNIFYPAMSASQNRPPKKPVPSAGQSRVSTSDSTRIKPA